MDRELSAVPTENLKQERAECLSAIELAHRYSANKWAADATAAPFRKKLAKIDEALSLR